LSHIHMNQLWRRVRVLAQRVGAEAAASGSEWHVPFGGHGFEKKVGAGSPGRAQKRPARREQSWSSANGINPPFVLVDEVI